MPDVTQSAAVTVAVDAMGGDIGPSAIVPGALASAREYGHKLILVGDQGAIQAELDKAAKHGNDVEVVHASQVAGMDEKPSDVLRRKKDSSIQVACRLVKEGRAQGVVSAGNSGATVACGMFILGRIKGVERPALASMLPSEKGRVVLIDAGANVDSKPHHLFQFGLMAEVFARDVLERPQPKIGLLSIGEEQGKGNTQVREAYALFSQAGMPNFVGNVEGRDIFAGEVDIVVCDGFVGNVALKLSEGLGASLARILKRHLKTGLSRVGALLSWGALRRFASYVDYAEYGGAPLLGLKGIVLVTHGASNSRAIHSAVNMAAAFIKNKANDHLVEKLSANENMLRFAKSSDNK